MWTAISNWLSTAPILAVAAAVLALMLLTATVGNRMRARHDRQDAAAGVDRKDSHEGYLVSAVLGLLALLTGFTFSMAVDRFDTRRGLVLEEANAIGTTYLRTQLLEEPHRARLSRLLVAYTDNRIELAKAGPDRAAPFLAINDRLVTELWTATVAAFPSIRGYDFSSSYLESMNTVIDLDAARKAARVVRVPPEVFLVLFLYMGVTAGVMAYVLIGGRGRATGIFLMVLTTLALMLVVDIDRPTRGGITESQGPMERLRASLHAQPPAVFDRWLIEDARAARPGPTTAPADAR